MGRYEAIKLETITEQEYPSGGVDHRSNHATRTELLTNLENLMSELESGLEDMGLTHNEARLYVFLAKAGAKKASDAAKILDIPRTETYKLLSSLQKKGLVSSTMHSPVRFVAVPLGDALNRLIGMEKQRLTFFERRSKALLDIWSSIADNAVTYEETDEEKFQILEGNDVVYRRIKDMVSSAEKEIVIMADQKHLVKLYHNEITDHFQSLRARGVDVRILTSFQSNHEMLKEIKRCELRALAEPCTNKNYIIVDKSQLVLFIKDNSESAPSAICTNCNSLVQCNLCLFEELWKRS